MEARQLKAVRRDTTSAEGRATGTVFKQLVAAGSKSERLGFGLLEDDDRFVLVHIIGDNPFGPSTLETHLGQRLSLRGIWRNGQLRVSAEEFLKARSDETPAVEDEPTPAEETHDEM